MQKDNCVSRSWWHTGRHTQTLSSDPSIRICKNNIIWSSQTPITWSFAYQARKWDPITTGHRRNVQDAFCVYSHLEPRAVHLWSDLSGWMLIQGVNRASYTGMWLRRESGCVRIRTVFFKCFEWSWRLGLHYVQYMQYTYHLPSEKAIVLGQIF